MRRNWVPPTICDNIARLSSLLLFPLATSVFLPNRKLQTNHKPKRRTTTASPPIRMVLPNSEQTASEPPASSNANLAAYAKKSNLRTSILSGSVGSIITSLVVTPLEVAKVRTQQRNSVPSERSPAKSGLCPRGCGKVVLFNGHLDCVVSRRSFPAERTTGGVFSVLRSIFVKEGFRGVYAGLQPTLVMAIPNTVLYFSAYEEIIWRLRDSDAPKWAMWTYPLVAGASARLVASSATSPFEFLRTRQATEGQVSQGMWRDFRKIIHVEGYSALYSGLRPTLWRDVPFSALYWFFLEEFRLYWRTYSPMPSPSEQASQAFVNGAAAGMIAAACTTPFDVVKTIQQTEKSPVLTAAQEHSTQTQFSFCKHGAIIYEPRQESSKSFHTFSIMKDIVQEEGWSGLWRGNQARMLKVAPSCAIMLSSYELGKRLLE